MDVNGIGLGEDFRKAIDKSVAGCTVLLALIGREWVDCRDAGGNRRLDSPNDFVRMELASALRRDIPVVPVLVRGALMPTVDELPEDIQELHYRNAFELSHARWKSDVHMLIEALSPYIGQAPTVLVVPASLSAGKEIALAAAEPKPGYTENGIAASRFDAQALERVTKMLAVYIGPISAVLVKKAARKSTTFEDLCGQLSKEIESEVERAKFVRSCRT